MTIHVLHLPYDVAGAAGFPDPVAKVYGKPLVYLDNGASAQKPRQVMDAMRAYGDRLLERPSRPALHGQRLDGGLRGGAREGARLHQRGVDRRDHLHALGDRGDQTRGLELGATYRSGDEIVSRSWSTIRTSCPGISIASARRGDQMGRVDDEGVFDLEGFEKLLTPRTKIVAITHMSNVLGTVTPLKEIVRFAHARGIPVLADGARRVVHLPVDVRDLDIDFYVFTGHKLYGPTGIGVLYAKKEWLERMRPYEGGGEMIAEVTTDTVTYNDPPHNSRPARRRSCRRSGSARPSTT